MGTRSWTGRWPSRKPPGWMERWRGKILNLLHQVHQVAQGRAPGVESGLSHQLPAPALVGDQLGQAVQAGGRDPQHLSHLPDGGPVAVADHVGHHGGAVAPVLPVHVLDHLFPAVVLDVQVDVGRLGPLPGQKALEKEIHLGRVHAGDPQGEADGGVGGRSPALAEDAVAAAVLDDLVHGQEVAPRTPAPGSGPVPSPTAGPGSGTSRPGGARPLRRVRRRRYWLEFRPSGSRSSG